MAKFSERKEKERAARKSAEQQQRLKELIKPIIEQRLKLIKLLERHGWIVHTLLPLPIEWRSCDVQRCEDSIELRDVDFEVKPPGAASGIVRGIEALKRLTIGMEGAR